MSRIPRHIPTPFTRHPPAHPHPVKRQGRCQRHPPPSPSRSTNHPPLPLCALCSPLRKRAHPTSPQPEPPTPPRIPKNNWLFVRFADGPGRFPHRRESRGTRGRRGLTGVPPAGPRRGHRLPEAEGPASLPSSFTSASSALSAVPLRSSCRRTGARIRGRWCCPAIMASPARRMISFSG